MILTAKDISQQLAARADSVARWLLPNGHAVSGMWHVGSVSGEAGNSLRIHLTGNMAGVWCDYASGNQQDRGDLLNLIAAVRNVKLGEAIKIGRDFLGIRVPQSYIPSKSYSTPKPKGLASITDESPVLTYLADERGIDIFTQEAFGIQQTTKGPNGPEIVFPYYSPDGELKNVKYLALRRDDRGKKIMRQEAGCAPTLFGWQALSPDVREVIITEGEIDAMTWHQMGFPALSIPDGAKGETWLEVEWDNLQRFDTIWLNWDNDKEGQSAVREFARRLGLHRCLLVTFLGFKDANDALKAGANEQVFNTALSTAIPLTPQQIKTPKDFEDKVIERFHPVDGKPKGFYSALFLGKFGMRPAELSIWSGIAGHGKSSMLSEIVLEAMHQSFRVAIASMELRGERTLHRMICQAQENASPSEQEIKECLNWLTGKLWIYDVVGTIQPKLLLELMEYSYARHGVQIFVIDSLMKCQVGQDDYDGQRIFLNQLYQFANETETHVNLVAHSRKGDSETQHPGKMDVLGSSTIINQASNILIVCRNKEKEERLREPNYIIKEEDNKEADATVYCNKQNETGDEFKARLRHARQFFRFSPMDGGQLILRIPVVSNQNEPQVELEEVVHPNGHESELAYATDPNGISDPH